MLKSRVLFQPYPLTLIAVFLVFLVMSFAYLHRVPGLMGDEGSEGENIYELQEGLKPLVMGERSYIGPMLDYVRMPFIALFGYTAFSLRLVVILFSVALFWLAHAVLTRQFGRWPALFGLAALTLSPIYLSQQRIGWAITLIPFFAFLILYLAQSNLRYKWLWVGLAAGLGLANHLLFFPTLAALALAGVITFGVYAAKQWYSLSLKDISVTALLLLTGFWAGFGMQFAVLQMFTEDQGDPSKTTVLLHERINDFQEAYPLYISASSYVARYTGVEFTSSTIQAISSVLLLLIFVGFVVQWRNKAVWLWGVGLGVHMLMMLYMIDRFTLRYFVGFSLATWLLAGLSVGALIERLLRKREWVLGGLNVSLTVVLVIWTVLVVFIPFLHTGGNIADFSLGNRTNSAADLVDIRPLVSCLRGAGPVFSENVHIWNRLQYLSHQYPDLVVVNEDHKGQAQWSVRLRDEEAIEKDIQADRCPELRHFIVQRESLIENN